VNAAINEPPQGVTKNPRCHDFCGVGSLKALQRKLGSNCTREVNGTPSRQPRGALP
jgi:hypothetical protein